MLAGIAEASVQGRRALGERAGAAVRRCGASADLLALAPLGCGPCHARGNGFDLHAAVVVPPRDRARLERLCRYALRPPIATDRLHLTADGHVVLDLRHRWADGTTQLLFEPVELARTAGGADAAPADQPAAVLRRAGRAIGVAVTPAGARARNSDRPGPGYDGRRVVIARDADPVARELAVGGADAAEFWLRRPRVPALRGSARTDRAYRRPERDPAHPASSRSAHGGARGPSRAASTATGGAIGGVA